MTRFLLFTHISQRYLYLDKWVVCACTRSYHIYSGCYVKSYFPFSKICHSLTVPLQTLILITFHREQMYPTTGVGILPSNLKFDQSACPCLTLRQWQIHPLLSLLVHCLHHFLRKTMYKSQPFLLIFQPKGQTTCFPLYHKYYHTLPVPLQLMHCLALERHWILLFVDLLQVCLFSCDPCNVKPWPVPYRSFASKPDIKFAMDPLSTTSRWYHAISRCTRFTWIWWSALLLCLFCEDWQNGCRRDGG